MMTRQDVLEMLEKERGPVSVRELVRKGASRSTISRMVKRGEIESPAVGLITAPGAMPSPHADWALVSARHPEAVVCLLSAASYHDMTQELPSALAVAMPHNGSLSMGPNFMLQIDMLIWRSEAMMKLGVDTVCVDGVDMRITSPERTLVDMFRYSSLNPSMRSSSVRITDEMFLDSLERCHNAASGQFSFETVSAIARELGCYDRMRPFTKTMRFRRADQPTL